MQKKTVLLFTLGAIAAGVAVYFFRKRKIEAAQDSWNHKKDKHLTQVFSKAKGYASGEYTL